MPRLELEDTLNMLVLTYYKSIFAYYLIPTYKLFRAFLRILHFCTFALLHLLGIIMAKSLYAKSIIIKGDSKLVINSLSNKC